jgi:hypothetical protein
MILNHRALACGLLLVAVLLLPGCYPPTQRSTGKGTAATQRGDHPDKGPHGGALVEWGEEEYHAEFTVDHGKKEATVYILDGSAKKAHPIKAESITLTLTSFTPPVQVSLKAAPQEGDPAGTASRFTGTHEKLGQEMDFKGEISGHIGDKHYTGDFDEKGHDHKHHKH